MYQTDEARIAELEARLQTVSDTNKILHDTNEMLLKEIPAIKNALIQLSEAVRVIALVINPKDEHEKENKDEEGQARKAAKIKDIKYNN